MDPLMVFDCEKILPNRFALALAAAARSRALARGHGPRLDQEATGPTELALHEIVAGAFTQEELAPFLLEGNAAGKPLLPRATGDDVSGSDPVNATAGPASLQEAVH